MYLNINTSYKENIMFNLPTLANIFTEIFGSHYVSALFFGEFDVPMKED